MRNESLWSGIRALVTGAIAARLVSIVSIPILTRLYNPSDFGELSMVSSIVYMLLPFSTFRYVAAIALPRRSDIARNLVSLCFTILFLQSLFVALAFFYWGRSALTLFGLEQFGKYWWILLLGFFAGGAYEILSSWAIRQREYRIVSATHFTQSVSGASVKILCGFLSAGSIGLILGFLTTKASGILKLLISYRSEHFSRTREMKSSRQKFLLSYYRDCLLFRMPAQFLGVASAHLPSLLFVAVYGLESGGQVGLAFSTISLPMTLLLNNIGRVTFGEAANIGRKKPMELYSLMVQLERIGLMFAVPIALCAFCFSDDILPYVYGNGWRTAASFVSILAILIPFHFLSNSLTQILATQGEQAAILMLNIRRLLFVASAFAISVWLRFSPTEALWVYVFALCVHSGLLIWKVRNQLRLNTLAVT